MSRMSGVSAPTPFMRDPQKSFDRARHQKWMQGDESESDSDDSDSDSDSDDETEGSSSSSSSSSASSSAASSSAVSLSSSRLSSRRSSHSSAGSSSAASSSAASSSASSSSAASSSSSSSASSSSSSPFRMPGMDKGRGGGVYRIEEEEQTGMVAAFKRWRLKKAAKRRNPTLLRFEEEHIRQVEEEERAAIARDKERIHKKRLNLVRGVNQQRQAEFKERLFRVERARFEGAVALRARQATQTTMVMGLLEEWGLERDKRQADQDAAAAAADEARRSAGALAKLNARRRGDEAAAEAARAGDEADTQAVLQLMRRAGTIAGANAPPKEPPEEQRETAKHVVLRTRPPHETAGLKRDRHFNLFTVDLRRFKNAEVAVGEGQGGGGFGVDGAVFLAQKLKQGCCPRLKVLKLGWCCIKLPGSDRLLDALGDLGDTSLLEEVDLRMNHLPAASVGRLCDHLKHRGALPNLRVLDLRNNVIGDEGAQHLAHAVLAGSLPKLNKLYVNGNQLTDRGVAALFKAFSAETVMCPRIEIVNCRDNVVSAGTLKSIDPCPIFFQV